MAVCSGLPHCLGHAVGCLVCSRGFACVRAAGTGGVGPLVGTDAACFAGSLPAGLHGWSPGIPLSEPLSKFLMLVESKKDLVVLCAGLRAGVSCVCLR